MKFELGQKDYTVQLTEQQRWQVIAIKVILAAIIAPGVVKKE
jgi:hypothetical protein